MLLFRGKLRKIKLKKQRLSKTLSERLNRIMREAAREFLRAAIPRVPVDTGMALGNLVPLGRFLNLRVPIYPKHKGSKTYYHYGKRTQYVQDKELGEIASDIFDGRPAFRFVEITPQHPRGEFSINIGTSHFVAKDGSRVVGGRVLLPDSKTPWGAIDAGADAWVEYMVKAKEKAVPNLLDYLVQIPVG